MSDGVNARLFESAVRRAGQSVKIEIDGVTYRKRAVIENSGKNFMRKYDLDETNSVELGKKVHRDKIAFIPYFEEFGESCNDIYFTFRGKRYLVIADSVMSLGDEPVYIWAVLSEVSKGGANYYD